MPIVNEPVGPHATDEQWESTTPSVTWINVTARNGEIKQVKVGGKPGQKFRVTVADRLANQDEVMEPHLDPFTNGLLNRLVGDAPVHPPLNSGYKIEDVDVPLPEPEQMISFDGLRQLLGKHGNAFRAAVAKLNELNLRRLNTIAEELPEAEQPTVAQKAAIDELLGTYKPGSTQASYRDFMGGPGEAVTAAGTRA